LFANGLGRVGRFLSEREGSGGEFVVGFIELGDFLGLVCCMCFDLVFLCRDALGIFVEVLNFRLPATRVE
jgi:hypothetical protein